jgi:hypothetical protein
MTKQVLMRRAAVLTSMMAWLTACIPGPLVPRRRGENVAFALFNNSGRVLHTTRVGNAGEPGSRWNGLAVHDPVPAFRLKDPEFGGAHYFAENGNRVPEEVEVSWRELPPTGAPPYTGELKGPYRVVVRSRVPSDVLKRAALEGYVVELSFSVGQLPILFNWRLVAFGRVTGAGMKTLAQGGDSFK